MKKISEFFKILPLFIFCIQVIYRGEYLLSIRKLNSLMDVWEYCEQWVRGEL